MVWVFKSWLWRAEASLIINRLTILEAFWHSRDECWRSFSIYHRAVLPRFSVIARQVGIRSSFRYPFALRKQSDHSFGLPAVSPWMPEPRCYRRTDSRVQSRLGVAASRWPERGVRSIGALPLRPRCVHLLSRGRREMRLCFGARSRDHAPKEFAAWA